MTELFPVPYPDTIPVAILFSAERTYCEALSLLEDTDVSAGLELRRELSNAVVLLRSELCRRTLHAAIPENITIARVHSGAAVVYELRP